MPATWKDNTIMFWNDSGTWRKITDHGRSSLSESTERIENKQRMVDGTLRRYSVAKKRSWTCSWDNIPSTNLKTAGLSTVDGGWAGEDMETFHNNTDGSFQVQFRRGDGTVTTATVMIGDFSKEVVKRGIVDLWNLDITLEEV
jgi:hypothetical protein